MYRQSTAGFRAAIIFTVTMLIGLVQFANVEAQDWMQFMGERGSATSTDAKIPTTWDAETNIKWKTELPGRGASSPIIVGDQIFLTCYTG